MRFSCNQHFFTYANGKFKHLFSTYIQSFCQVSKKNKIIWNFLEHRGPFFPPDYEPLPSYVKFYYDGKEMKLSPKTEEMATFYAKLIEHEYTTKERFNNNFFSDWRKLMTGKEQAVIKELTKCNFRPIHEHFIQISEEKKKTSKEKKKELKLKNDKIAEEYGYCTIDGLREKVGNYKIEPPGLFRGRGEHPKMGALKKRILPEDVIINCSSDSKIPVPPDGHQWKEVRHDNTVTWLACWKENVLERIKYIWLNQSSKLLVDKDREKYEVARRLAKCIKKIRRNYEADLQSEDLKLKQRAVALYFIDKLALRVGNEKEEDEADTVGCCSLRVEHIRLIQKDDSYIVVFDFLGKDSIPYYNEVTTNKLVFDNLSLFCQNKNKSDDLFDKLNANSLNMYLNKLMPRLTTKVFRTYNASTTLQKQLNEITDDTATISEKMLQYNRANKTVALLCNHQRTIPKLHENSVDNLKAKIRDKKKQIKEIQKQLNEIKDCSESSSVKSARFLKKMQNKLNKLSEQLKKLKLQMIDKEENKSVALGTSKLNYLDPRITVAWCKKHEVPVEKIYTKTQRSKFQWAIESASSEYKF